MSASAARALPGIFTPRSALLPFPTSVGILFGISLSAHLAAIVYGASGETLSGSFCFGVGQLSLSLGLLRLYDGAWVLQDIRIPFVIFMFLYGFSLTAFVVATSTEFPGLSGAAFFYGTAFLGFNLVQWWYKRPWVDVSTASLANVRPTFANAAVVLLVFAAIVGYAWVRGIREFLTFDRSQMRWLYSQAWIVSMMLMNGFVMYIFAGWPRLGRNSRRLAAAAVIAFVVLQLGFGNRHAFFPMFMFLVGIVATRRRAVIGPRTITFALAAFVLLMAFGIARQVRHAPWLLYRGSTMVKLAEANEFTMPIQTLTYYVTADKPLKYGLTYLAAPTVFIPRVLWPEKPTGLSQEFNKDRFGGAISIGYAYTPVTEAYLNLSFVGPFIVMSLVSLATVFLVKHAQRRPILYFACFSLVFDFHRGDSTAVLYPLVVILVAFALMQLLSRIEWAPRALRGIWPPPAPPERVPGS